MNIAVAFIVVVLTLVAALGLLAVIFPFRPFVSRKAALLTSLLSLVSIFAIGTALPKKPSPLPITTEKSGDDSSALRVATHNSGSIPLACGQGGLVLNDIVAVNGDVLLRTGPSEKAEKIKNAKASDILGTVQFHQIDRSTTVKRLCAQADWTQVIIATPEWLNDVQGWVPSKILREIEHQKNGSRLYVENDFNWDKDTVPYKMQIVDVINKISSNNEKCGEIDTGALSLSPSKSKANDPVFFVTCGQGTDAFNVWFRPKDASSNKTFEAVKPLGQEAAVALCEQAAQQAATHPSTMIFSKLWDLSYQADASGRARVVSSFTAKNAFNLELKFRIDCLFDGAKLLETIIAETSR